MKGVKALLVGVAVATVAVALGSHSGSAVGGSSGERAAVVGAAASQVGLGDPEPYWVSAAPGVLVPERTDWCGGFALWALHAAGLALDWAWEFGRGFLLTQRHSLPTTRTPQPGDIAYFDHNQHHAVVESVDGGGVTIISGNGEHGLVSRSTVAPSAVTAFFSIEPLLGARA